MYHLRLYIRLAQLLALVIFQLAESCRLTAVTGDNILWERPCPEGRTCNLGPLGPILVADVDVVAHFCHQDNDSGTQL